MISHLTYRPREGIVFGTVAGRAIRLATLRNHAGQDIAAWRQAAGSVAPRVTDWPKTQELRSGAVPAGAVRHRLTVAENAALEVYDYPGAYAQRFDGVDPDGAARHRHHHRVVWVKGLHFHGPPGCGSPRCLVIGQDWDSLFQALKIAGQLSIVVEL